MSNQKGTSKKNKVDLEALKVSKKAKDKALSKNKIVLK